MLAVNTSGVGGPELLDVGEVPDPVPASGELLVRNFASALNRADLLQRRGLYPPPRGVTDIPGLEFAGEVAALGAGVTRFRVGDRVFGIVAGGGHAELVRVHDRLAVTIPDTLSFEAAAAVPEAFFTAYENLVTHGGLRAGETLVVHAAGSGVGVAAVQLGRRLGARVIATGRTADKLERCRELGAHETVLVQDAAFEDEIRRLTDGRGADVVLDFVGASYWDSNIRVLAPGGRLLVVGLLGGARVELDLGTLLMRRLTVRGSAMRGLPIEDKIAITERFREHVLPDLAAGRLKPVIDRVFMLDEVRLAHERMEANANFGKIVLRM